MRYYLGRIKVQNGEYAEHVTIKFKTIGDAMVKLNEYARDWYGGENAVKKNGYYELNHGEICTTPDTVLEVTRETYEAVSIITDLTDM